MLPLLHIDEEALRPRIERAKRRSLSLRRETSPDDAAIVSQLVRSHSIAQAEVSSRLGMRRERCSSCGEPVFLAEKLVVARSVYHRSCFRCARCRHQLTPGNYYETEDGQYCCEACPIDDIEEPPSSPAGQLPEQPPQFTSQREHPDYQQQSSMTVVDSSSSEAALLEAPLSDEEKSKRRSLERQRTLQLQLEREHERQKSANADAAPDAAPEDDHDDKFDEMIKLINDRIDELTTSTTSEEEQQPPPLPEQPPPDDEEAEAELAAASPLAARRARDSPVHSAPDDIVVQHCRTTTTTTATTTTTTTTTQQPQHSTKKQPSSSPSSSSSLTQDTQTRPLRRSSSLRLVSDNTKDQPWSSSPPPSTHRRLSLAAQQSERRLFEGDDDEQQQQQQQPVAADIVVDKQLNPEQHEKQEEKSNDNQNDYPDDLNPFASDEEPSAKKPTVSTNPFGSDDDDDDDDDEELPPKPMARTKSKRRVLEAPQINLNPFWSDDDGHESEAELRDKSPPVPRPRTLRHSHADGTATLQPKSNLTISNIHSSNTSIASSCSTLTPGGTYRKKKPAPPPPIPGVLTTPPRSLDQISHSSLSPRLTPRTRKSKPAPPPPPSGASTTTTPSPHIERYSTSVLPESESELTRLAEQQQAVTTTTTTAPPWQQSSGDNDKLSKDEANRNTRSLSCTENSLLYPGQLAVDKSLEGKWKRKKGPAPARPMPLRRKIKVMSMKDVKLELDQIEMQQQGLERQGVRLEQIIRDKCESGTASEEASLGLDVEELVLELFALVNEKNELFRRQAELMLLRRQQRLEEEHADIEYQVRCLITQPEATKTDFDKQREETLIQRLVEIVERRNEIVECLEMDRRREIEEDRSIHREMDLYAARNKAENVNVTDESRRSTLKFKKGKAKEKVKEKKSKKSSKKDADKDVDEIEAKLKRHTLRKWF